MRKNPFVSFLLAGVSLTDWGLKIPSPFSNLTLTNNQITSFTQWELKVVVGGDSENNINIAAFEALLYSAAQSAAGYSNSSGIPVSFLFGWQTEEGTVDTYASYQGFTINFKVSTNGRYMTYTLTGYATLAVQTSMPVLNIPAVSGIVQPSAIVEALAKATKATNYYTLDIDHNDSPTLVQHNALTTSFNSYVRGTFTGQDDYSEFPGLVKLSKSYNSNRDAGGLDNRAKSLSQVINNIRITPLNDFLKISITDNTPQCSSFSYWVDEPTMTKPGIIHYKSNAGLAQMMKSDVLEYGTANTNILSLSGSYSGVSYNMTNMSFSSVGFVLDGSGNAIANAGTVVNSWSSSLSSVFQTANIINDVNAIASQFSGDFTIEIPGETKAYTIAQPVSLLVISGNTISPITGIYNIVSVSHNISMQFITTLKIQRLVMSSANEVASSQGILSNGKAQYLNNSYSTTSNIISPSKVEFGEIYPDFSRLTVV